MFSSVKIQTSLLMVNPAVMLTSTSTTFNLDLVLALCLTLGQVESIFSFVVDVGE